MKSEEELLELRALYDELWRDAKTMIHDMSESISMYKFSGFFVFLFCSVSLWAVLGGSLNLLAGSPSFLDYFNVSFGVFATLFFIYGGLRLLRVYYRLKERYAKLLQKEKDIED